MCIANAKTLKPSYLVSEILANVGAPQVYGEKLIKPAMLACASKVIGKDAASAVSKFLYLMTLLQEGKMKWLVLLRTK